MFLFANALLQARQETGAVFTFGKSHFAENEPSHFFIKHDPVVAISCGDEHSAVICQNGRVFVFGGNNWGQLGLGHNDEVTRPSCVKWLKPHRALFVACGRAHTVFVTGGESKSDTNAIYTVGWNEAGQLGTGDTEAHTIPQFVELSTDSAVKQLSAGSEHTAVLTEDGRVFVCGSNSEGQLGLGEDARSIHTFQELKFMEEIAFVECGYYHTVFITKKGAVFITGDNENQKLGIPSTNPNIYVPEVLPLDCPIKSACCGASHTFLLSMDESKILAFGSNENGQLGLDKAIEIVKNPIEIDMEKMFDGFQLKLVACGAMHTAFITDNGLLYTCGESRHNKLCLDDIDNPAPQGDGDAPTNQYTPKRVSSMNGFIVDNVACGGCHTLLTATKGSNSDFTNNDFNVITDENRQVLLTELPPLQKLPANITMDNHEIVKDVENMNVETNNVDVVNGNAEDTGSMDSLEANVSGSHIVNINDLENENASMHDIPAIMQDVKDDIDKTAIDLKTEAMDTVHDVTDAVDNTTKQIEHHISSGIKDINEKVDQQIEKANELVSKVETDLHNVHDDVLKMTENTVDAGNSPLSKTPLIQELLHVPDLSQMSPSFSKHSDDGQKSENGQSENETIACASDKSSPQLGKVSKTQAVMPIVRSDDCIDAHLDGLHPEDADAVENKEKGRFAKIFQSIKDKEHSCMGRGKVIEENVTTTIHKGIDNAEETVHKIEESVQSEIRNHTNSRACNIL